MSYRKTAEFRLYQYTVESFGNGAAYLVTRADKKTMWVQGEDAKQLRNDTVDFTNPDPLSEYTFADET